MFECEIKNGIKSDKLYAIKIKRNEIRKFLDNSEETEYTVITEVVR